MKFAQVLNYFENKPHVNSELAEIDVKGLCYDSRKAEKGFIFFAIKGYKADGHDYIYKALDYGAAIVFIEKNRQGDFQDNNLSDKFVFVENTRQALAFCSKAFYSNPGEKMKIIGVTGTNGKTSITYMIKAAVNSANEKCGVIGTIAYFLGDKKIKAPNTTPESLEIYKMMHEMVRLNCKVCVMEVSSHALFLNRVDGIDFDAAIFTNLSEDHLDFHSNMEEYLNAKLLLFDLLKKSSKKNKYAVINADSDVYDNVKNCIEKLNLNYKTYSINSESNYRAENITLDINRNDFDVNLHKKHHFSLNLLGRFNVLNALAVIACLDCLGYEINNVKHGLENVNVPGRFQRIDSPSGFTVIVDYAHTNDALENVLTAIKNLGPKKIISVFGCGGDRDTGKRSLMGEISTRIADFTIITSDNPRTEDPEKIMDMIETGAKIGAGKYIRITDREKAIAHGISLACEGDIVLIAGKGHEDYQILGEKVIHFDDVETARKYV